MKTLRLISLCVFLVMMLSAFFLPGLVLAQDEGTPPPPADNITLSTEFPDQKAEATGSFTFYAKMAYSGQIDRVFNLDAVVPTGWSAYVSPQYDTTKISSITMEKSTFNPTTKSVKISASPPPYTLAEPGNYPISFKASSGNLTATISYTAIITARYALNAVPTNQLYNTNARAGQDNTFSIIVGNTGTAPLDNVTFASDKPTGWEITFKPEKIDVLDVGNPTTVDVNIKPAAKSVAGDYVITLRISGKQAYAGSMEIRVTVVTPNIWGWVGVGIILVVVICLIVIFMRFGRR